MKYQGCTSYYTEDVAYDIWRLYNRLLKESGGTTMLKDIYQQIADSPAPRYYVTSRRANEVVQRIASGKPMCKMQPLRAEMYCNIYNRARAMKDKHPKRSLKECVERILNMRAPSFFLSAGRIKNIIHKCNHEKVVY